MKKRWSQNITLCCMSMNALLHYVLGSQILLLTPPVYSHCNKFGAIGESLNRLGHSVTAYVPHTFDVKNCFVRRNISIITYGEETDQSVDTFDIMRQHGIRTFWPGIRAVRHVWCSRILNDRIGLRQLQDIHFDLAVISSSISAACYLLIPYRLNISFVSLDYWHVWFESGKPFIPHMETPSFFVSGEATWIDRLLNTFIIFFRPYLLPLYLQSESESLFAPELSYFDHIVLIRKSLLFIEDEDIILSGAHPVLPNTIHTGGFSVQPPLPLPEDIERFFTSATNGVIVVTFGGSRKRISTRVAKIMQTVFKRVPQKILVRNTEIINLPNVMTKTWIPQNDVLGHNKTKLFISHCGRNGAFEAIYHGVPVICLPFILDQPVVASNLVARGMGIQLDPDTMETYHLSKAISRILDGREFSKNAKLMSALYKDIHNEPAGDIAGRAIDHVIKYGGDHLRPSTLDYSFVSFLLLDVWLFVGGGVITAVSVVYLSCRCVRFSNKWRKLKKE